MKSSTFLKNFCGNMLNIAESVCLIEEFFQRLFFKLYFFKSFFLLFLGNIPLGRYINLFHPKELLARRLVVILFIL